MLILKTTVTCRILRDVIIHFITNAEDLLDINLLKVQIQITNVRYKELIFERNL